MANRRILNILPIHNTPMSRQAHPRIHLEVRMNLPVPRILGRWLNIETVV